MARRGRAEMPKLKEDLSPNIIPMVDIMFLLLLFFMLSADMAARDLAAMTVPRAVTAEVDDVIKDDSDKKLALVNIYHLEERYVTCSEYPHKICRNSEHWRYYLDGEQFLDTPEDIAKLKNKIKVFRDEFDTEISKKTAKSSATSPSEMSVVIRADQSAPFGYAQKIMQLCSELFLYRVEMRAVIEGEEKTKG